MKPAIHTKVLRTNVSSDLKKKITKLAKTLKRFESEVGREAFEDILKKYEQTTS